MMLNANYAVLYRDEFFDLTPLWEALAAQHSTDVLTGLFIRFAETLHERGLKVVMPPQVAGLTPEQQRMHLDAFDGQASNGEAEAEVVALTDELESLDVGAPAPPVLELNTGDLRPYVAPETRREIVQAVIQSVKASPVGDRIDVGQLAFLVDSNFDSLCDGSNFDMQPVLQGLRDLGNVPDRDLFLAPTLLREALQAHSMTVSHQPLDVSDAEARQLRLQHEKDIQKAKRDAMLAVTHTVDAPLSPPTGDTEAPATARAEARKTQLRRLGLGRVDPKTIIRVRMAVLLALLSAIAIPSYLFRSSRPLSVAAYRSSMPLASAHLQDGNFVGKLNDDEWWPLTFEERTERLLKFQDIIRKQGFSPNLQVRDAKNRLVVINVGAGRLRGSPFFMKGKRNGTLVERPDYSSTSAPPPPTEEASKTEEEPSDSPGDAAAPPTSSPE